MKHIHLIPGRVKEILSSRKVEDKILKALAKRELLIVEISHQLKVSTELIIQMKKENQLLIEQLKKEVKRSR